MAESRITYLGPTEGDRPPSGGARPHALWKRVPLAFLVVVALPTLATAIYFLFIASPRYVSEARFIVRAASQEQPSTLGVALQGVGLSSNATDAFAVHEYIQSRDSLSDLSKSFDVAAVLARPGVDPLSRYPKFGADTSREGLFKALQKFVTVGYESSTGISTLRVQAFNPTDAQAINAAMLDGGERLVNRLNNRASARAVDDAERAVIEAEQRLRNVQSRLNMFRNREGIVDPMSAAAENTGIISELSTTIATLQAERAQISSQAPQSPQLPSIDARLAAFRGQLAIERQKVAGNAGSLATKVGGYEAMEAERTMADRALAAASAGLDSARIDARRQKLYLERVVNPSRPDAPSQPRRLMAILVVFITTMLIYGIGWLVWAGLREHRQV